MAELRLGLHKGLRQNEPRLGSGVCARLLVVVDRIGPPFFLPIVYRVDPGAIDRSGGEQQGSGLTGSREYLVADLREDEFQVIVFDVATPEDAITQLARGDLSAAEVLDMLMSEIGGD